MLGDRQLSLPAVLSVGSLPGRKKPCLYVTRGNVVSILANFKNRAAMDEFLAMKPTFTVNPKETTNG